MQGLEQGDAWETGRMLEWNDLRLVLELARAGSLSGAARVLGVNHGTVSRQLARLEARSGTRFFERLPEGVRPTVEGATVATRAEAMEAEAIALDLELAARTGEGGVLRVTIPPLLADARFAEDIALWQAEHPAVELHILGDNRILDLHRREADVAIRVSHAPAESLWGRKITDQRAGLYASEGFLNRYRAALEGEGALPVVGFTAWEAPVAKSIRARFANATLAALCDDMVAAESLVRQGIGLTRMPCFMGGRGLLRVPGTPLVPYMPIWALTHPDLRNAPLVAGFLRFIAGRFSGRSAHYLGSD
ncbi:LysR family transcriptional regulator [Vannielia litorea]|uniref:LysR family transcriptional regulator n=1 Tax=Vannielia litorea TaxID=1217970 RepID=UPI001C983F43|nr:LysR family transcriptional regulator [Vannielia litorea]MBY6153195.1 LysR family transcriptional regulator [Vannielia litorea]